MESPLAVGPQPVIDYVVNVEGQVMGPVAHVRIAGMQLEAVDVAVMEGQGVKVGVRKGRLRRLPVVRRHAHSDILPDPPTECGHSG